MLDGLSTELVGAAIYDLGRVTLSRVSSNEWVQTTLKKWNLKSEQHDFATRYLEALCELSVQGKQIEILQFFRYEDVRHTFFKFYYGDSTIRGNEDLHQQSLSHCVEALHIGDDIKAAKVDVGAEIQVFWVAFQQKVQESRTVKEVEIEQQIRQLKITATDIQQMMVEFKEWMVASGKDHLQIADKIYNIEKIDNATFNNLLNSPAQGLAKTDRAARYKPVPFLYPRPYVGRETDVKRLESFFKSPHQHFLFLFGTGGIGKSHLLQEVAERLAVQPAYFKLSQATKFITLANEMGYGDFAVLTPTQQRDLFLKKAADETVPLIFDDFYEVGDEFLYKTILALSNQRKGKVLLISRTLPLDYDGVYIGEERQLELNELGEEDFSRHLTNYHERAGYDFELSSDLINACWEHCKGYPLGGEFLLKLRNTSGNDFGQDIVTIGKIDPGSNKRHHDFMKRLLGSILEKGSLAERELAKQMAVFTESMHRDVFIGLPAFERDAFYSLTERKKIFYSIPGDFFGVHALVRTVLEGEMDVSTNAHIYAGKHYESDEETLTGVTLENLNKAVYHFEKSKTPENEEAYSGFLARWKPKFNFISVKVLIVADTKKTIDNFRFRLCLEPNDFSAMNELGRAFRKDGQIRKAIEVLKKAAAAGNVHSMNELGMTYRQVNRLPEAIEVLKKAAAAGNVHSMNELGMTYRQAQRLPEAIEVLKKAADTGQVHSMNELGMTYREAQQLPEAIEVLKKAADTGNVHSMNELGMTYRQAQRLSEAIEVLKKAADAGNIQSMNELGMTYREAQRLSEAIEVLKKAADTGNIHAMNELGITYREAQRLPEAIEVLKKATFLQPNNVILLNELGMTYREAQRLPEAIKVLKKAADTGHVHSMNELGMTYRQAQRLPEAIEVLKKAADTGHVHAMNELGITYREAQRLPEAIKVLEKAADAGNIHAMNELGMTYRQAKRLPEAIEVLKKATFLQPNNVILLNELGMTYREAQRLPEAIEVLKKAADTGNIHAMNELGMTYRQAQRLPEAIEVLKKATFLQPNNVILLNELGMTYREAQRLPEAIEVLKKAADTGNIHAMNELGITYREAQRLPEAIKVLEKAADAGNIHAMNELGITYREAQRLPEAIKVLEKAADAGNIHAMNELGITYRKAQRLPEAIKVWEDVLSEYPNHHHTRLAILQIHLFYSPDVEKVKEHFRRLSPKFPANHIRLTYESIIKCFESIVTLESHDKSLYRSYIWLLFKYQSWDWAVIFLEKLTQVHPSTEFKSNLGKALSMVGRAKEAKHILKSAMEATDRPGMERYFQQNAADYLDALKLTGSNKEARKKFERLRERLSSLPDFELRKAYWLGEEDNA